MNIVPATHDDIPELVILVESCYRGDTSRKGWTTEADMLDGTRITPSMMKEDMEKPGAVILKGLDSSGKIVGCVYTERQNEKLYTGMLCVHPELQTGGLGKRLMTAVDDMARKYNCSAVKMHVISRRKELIEWYERRGFRKTGDTAPFPTKEGFGIQKVPLEFVVMQKDL